VTSRIPRLALAAWAVAAAIVVGLALGVGHYLGQSGTGHGMGGAGGMSGMHMGSAEALTRGGADQPSNPLLGAPLVTAWQLDAIAIAVLVLVAAAYLTGVALAARRWPGSRWPMLRTASFFSGLAVCAYATNGSIAVYDQVLFSAHMAGHLALVMVAPALLAVGQPLTLALAASSPRRRAWIERAARGRVVSLLTAPPVALASYAGVIVGSHLTGLMDTIMRNTWAGQLEHLVYVLVGYEFFVLVVGDEPIRWRLASPVRWLLLAIAMAVDTFTGIVLMQGTRAVDMLPSTLDVNALSDTRTGGAIMWFGGDAIMAVIMIALVVGWLRSVDRTPVSTGWLEQARTATFAEHTGSPVDAVDDDADDRARAAYNDWLEKLDRS
jgi:cytochrome c oxidase assembly factor CtaG